MEIIREIVQNVLIIVLLNMLLEMLMPSSSLSRYIKLVMGLFIIVAILNPILNFINKDLSIMTLYSADGPSEDLNILLKQGKELAESNKQVAVNDFNDKVARQVKALAELNGKNKIQKVVVNTETDPENAQYGSLKEIIVYMGQPVDGEEGDPSIEPIEINVQGRSTGDESKEISDPGSDNKKPKIQSLQKIIADFYALDEEKITIVEEGK